MVEGISTNSLIAQMYGPGAMRRAGGLSNIRPGNGQGDLAAATRVGDQPPDSVEISEEARRAEAATKPNRVQMTTAADTQGVAAAKPSLSKARQDQPGETRPDGASGAPNEQLSQEDEDRVRELKERDQEVRRHEQAHMGAGGGLVQGGASYEYTTGPDGKQYATSGEVQIDSAPVPNDPQSTIAKMQQVIRAALAPAQPSGADRAVAANARAVERQARAELAKKQSEERGGELGEIEGSIGVFGDSSPIQADQSATSVFGSAENASQMFGGSLMTAGASLDIFA